MSIAGWTEADLSRWLDQRLDEFGRVKMAAVAGSIGGERILDGSISPEKLLPVVERDSATFLGTAIPTTRADISGISVEAPNAGTYLCTCDFSVYVDNGYKVTGGIAVDGTAQADDVIVAPSGNSGIVGVFSRTWLLSDLSEGATVTPQVVKDAGDSTLTGTTSLTLWQVG